MNLQQIKSLKTLQEALTIMQEALLDTPGASSPEEELDVLIKKLGVARNLLAMLNRKATAITPEDRKKHKAKVLGFLSRLQASIKRIEKQVASEE
jgi:hypothetical protein